MNVSEAGWAARVSFEAEGRACRLRILSGALVPGVLTADAAAMARLFRSHARIWHW